MIITAQIHPLARCIKNNILSNSVIYEKSEPIVPGMQMWINIQNSINLIHQISRLKKKHMVKLKGEKVSFDTFKNQLNVLEKRK